MNYSISRLRLDLSNLEDFFSTATGDRSRSCCRIWYDAFERVNFYLLHNMDYSFGKYVNVVARFCDSLFTLEILK